MRSIMPGEYYYTPHNRGYRIYRCDSVTEGGSAAASPLRDEPTYYDREKARKRVYELNGWKYNKR